MKEIGTGATQQRLIDANELENHRFPTQESLYNSGWNDAIDAIMENSPIVDAVEVVRCYKCIHWDEDTVRRNSNDATWWNEAVCRKYSDDIWDAWKDADWFCADGERKTDG